MLTDNRDEDGPDSLEATIRAESQSGGLPAFTLAHTARMLEDRLQAERVAERLLDQPMRIDGIRGAGRIHVP